MNQLKKFGVDITVKFWNSENNSCKELVINIQNNPCNCSSNYLHSGWKERTVLQSVCDVCIFNTQCDFLTFLQREV